MIYFIGILLVLLLVLGPNWWVKHTIKKYGSPREDFPGNGGEFARHLLNKFELNDVAVEETDQGDHYDAQQKTVRLLGPHFHERSLTAIVIAAHEVGHAIQDASNYKPLRWRHQLAKISIVSEQIGSVLMFAIPIVAALARSPHAIVATYALGALVMFSSVVLHILTLPVELDASFRRALPLLKAGQYIPEEDLPKARNLLRAAAFTYAAASLTSLLNFWRWLSVLRR